jgi:DNA primase
MAIFEKKLRSIAGTIKDDFIKKYVLEFFLEKISTLTPHSNLGKKQFYIKKIKSLQSTQKHFNESRLLSGVELKEFSLLYLIMNNLDIFQENIHMVENIKLFSNENKLILESLITKLKSGEKLTLQEIPIDPQLIQKIFKFASIKHILNSHQNNQDKMFELLEEVTRDLKNYDLEFRIEELESKFSKDLSESTFNEIRELKKQKNIN